MAIERLHRWLEDTNRETVTGEWAMVDGDTDRFP